MLLLNVTHCHLLLQKMFWAVDSFISSCLTGHVLCSSWLCAWLQAWQLCWDEPFVRHLVLCGIPPLPHPSWTVANFAIYSAFKYSFLCPNQPLIQNWFKTSRVSYLTLGPIVCIYFSFIWRLGWLFSFLCYWSRQPDSFNPNFHFLHRPMLSQRIAHSLSLLSLHQPWKNSNVLCH